MKKKTVALLLALVLVFGGVIGGTVAWLTDSTDQVVNTFTDSDIDIILTETTGESYKMIPGHTITKDPTVTVKAGSEKCWLFVKVEKVNDFDSFMTYEIAEDWTQGTGTDGIPADVYYCEVEAGVADQPFAVIKDNKVTVKDTVTKEMMNSLTETTYPKLTLTAYASQYSKDGTTAFTAAEAWKNISGVAGN